jgi:predicted dehydrogenase
MKYQVGLVGLRRGEGLTRALATHPQVKIAALCDIKKDVVAAMGQEFNLPDNRLFTNFDDFVNIPLDIVVIATPIEFHAYQTIASLEAGKHVLCEHTPAYTIEDCERIVNTVRRTGKTYMLAENSSYLQYIREFKRIIDAGKLGEIYYAEGEYVHDIAYLLIDPETGDRLWRYTRAPIWYCVHCLGPLLMLMNDRVVKATGASTGNHTYPNESIAFIDMEVGLFQTEKKAVIKILRSQVAKRYPPYLEFHSLYGTQGFVENGRTSRANKGLLYIEGEMAQESAGERSAAGAQVIDCPWVDPNAPPEALSGGHGTSEYYMVRDFIEALNNNVRPPHDVIRAMDYTVPGIVAHEAAMKGGVWLDVPQFNW